MSFGPLELSGFNEESWLLGLFRGNMTVGEREKRESDIQTHKQTDGQIERRKRDRQKREAALPVIVDVVIQVVMEVFAVVTTAAAEKEVE